MNRSPFIPCLLVLLLMDATPVFAGTTTLTTYYPAPSGNYNQLRLVPLDTPPASCPVGTLYADSATGKLMYCGAPGAWEYADVWTQSGNSISPVNNAWNVGIGGALYLNGQLATVSAYNFKSASSGILDLNINRPSGAKIQFRENDTDQMFIMPALSGGGVTIVSGLTVGQSATIGGSESVGGNETVAGSVTAGSYLYSSDQRLKKNIRPLTHALDKIQHLNGVRFTWKKNDVKDIGVIAQNVETVVPELVKTDKDGMKSVAYGNLTALLIEAVKEQQKQIEDLKKQVAKLQK